MKRYKIRPKVRILNSIAGARPRRAGASLRPAERSQGGGPSSWGRARACPLAQTLSFIIDSLQLSV